MFLNIITPCYRTENLHKISKSINIPRENYRWMVICDLNELPPEEKIPENCEIYLHTDKNSKVGNSQRNFALDLINDGYVYFNDDDTIIHSDLWKNIMNCDSDFISFIQERKDKVIRLRGKVIEVGSIDTHNFVVSRSIVGKIRWKIDEYRADGMFARECKKESKSYFYIPKVLSTYNSLR